MLNNRISIVQQKYSPLQTFLYDDIFFTVLTVKICRLLTIIKLPSIYYRTKYCKECENLIFH